MLRYIKVMSVGYVEGKSVYYDMHNFTNTIWNYDPEQQNCSLTTYFIKRFIRQKIEIKDTYGTDMYFLFIVVR